VDTEQDIDYTEIDAAIDRIEQVLEAK